MPKNIKDKSIDVCNKNNVKNNGKIMKGKYLQQTRIKKKNDNNIQSFKMR